MLRKRLCSKVYTQFQFYTLTNGFGLSPILLQTIDGGSDPGVVVGDGETPPLQS